MSAPAFYCDINTNFQFICDTYGKDALIDYWRGLGEDYYRSRWEQWREGGAAAIAEDWRDYFTREPGAKVRVSHNDEHARLDIDVCPAIAHIRSAGRTIVPYFCEHCDHICTAMAERAGYRFEREGGMGECVQRFVKLTTNKEPC